MSESVPRLTTARLHLIPCTADLARAVRDDPRSVSALLGSQVAPGWPEAPIREFLPMYATLLEADPELLGWGVWIIRSARDNVVVGDIGFKGKPDREGAVEIGYSVVPAYRRRGYASEAARALVAWAFTHSAVKVVLADCEPGNLASIGVLRSLGMMLLGETGGLLAWELRRP